MTHDPRFPDFDRGYGLALLIALAVIVVAACLSGGGR